MKVVGFSRGLYRKGVSIPPGGMVRLPDGVAAHFLAVPGSFDLTPSPVADGIWNHFGLPPEHVSSDIELTLIPPQ